MRLLFDQNLSFTLCARLADVLLGAAQVRLVRLEQASNRDL